MAKVYPNPLCDPRYQQLVMRYRYNWLAGVRDLFGRYATPQQADCIFLCERKDARVAIASGHGTGKSDLLACLLLIMMLTQPGSRNFILAVKASQVKSGVFKYVQAHWKTLRKRYPWITKYFDCDSMHFYAKYAKSEWLIGGKSCKDGQEESLAGEHAEAGVNWILDECSGINPRAIDVIAGSLTQGGRLIAISQPTRNSGQFFDMHHKLRKVPGQEGGIYDCITLNSEESPLVRIDWIRMMRTRYGGDVTHPEYLIKVKGQFSDSADSGIVFTQKTIERGINNRPNLRKGWGWVAICDVGDGKDKSVILLGQMSGYGLQRTFIPHKLYISRHRALRFAAVINNFCDPNTYNNVTICVDASGIGSATCDRLRELGRDVQALRWGLPPWADEEKLRYYNQRALGTMTTKELIQRGNIRLPDCPQVREEGVTISYFTTEKGQFQITSKDNMKKQGFHSPDVFDTFCMIPLVVFNPVDKEHGMSEKQKQEHRNDIALYRELMGLPPLEYDHEGNELTPEQEDDALWRGEGQDWDEDEDDWRDPSDASYPENEYRE